MTGASHVLAAATLALMLSLSATMPAIAQPADTTEETAREEGAEEASDDGAVTLPERIMEDADIAVLGALDKITARLSTLEVPVGDTVAFGRLFIKPQACREPPPDELPESAAFLEIWEIEESGESTWVYTGWMFASSPALAAMDHAVYDIWVVDCRKLETTEDSAPQ